MQIAQRIYRSSFTDTGIFKNKGVKNLLLSSLYYVCLTFILFWVNRLVLIPSLAAYFRAAHYLTRNLTGFEIGLLHHLLDTEIHFLQHIFDC